MWVSKNPVKAIIILLVCILLISLAAAFFDPLGFLIAETLTTLFMINPDPNLHVFAFSSIGAILITILIYLIKKIFEK